MTTSRYCRCEHDDGRSAVWTIIKDVINMSLMHTPEGLQKRNNITCALTGLGIHPWGRWVNIYWTDLEWTQSLGCSGAMKDMPLTSVAPRKGWESHSVGKFMFEIDGTATWRDCWCLLMLCWQHNNLLSAASHLLVFQQAKRGHSGRKWWWQILEEGNCCLGSHEIYGVLFCML